LSKVRSLTAGLLIPRINTTQRNAISSPANGLLIYNTDTNALNYFDGTSWQAVDVAGSGVTNVSSANTDIAVANGATTPVLTLNSGTTGGAGDANKIATGTTDFARLPVGNPANTVAAGNDPRFSNSRNPTGSAGGNLGGYLS
jgi:hypothetical protein